MSGFDVTSVRHLHAQQNGTIGDDRQVRLLSRDSTDVPIKLYITGVPRSCKTSFLEDLFADYGSVLEISRSTDNLRPDQSRLWVTYGSFREAESAMEGLNGMRIDETHSLRLEMSISERERARFKSEMESNGATSTLKYHRKCVACSFPAGQQCGSCKAPYCSSDCQRRDWTRHKSQCSFTPKSLNVNGVIAPADVDGGTAALSDAPPAATGGAASASHCVQPPIPVTNPEKKGEFTCSANSVPLCTFVPKLGETVKIIITELKNLGEIFVQVIVPESLDVLSTLEAGIAEMKTGRPKSVQVGDFLLALFDDGLYYRAEVLGIDGDLVELFFLDYGNREVASLKSLRFASEELSRLPRLCFPVKLSSSKYSISGSILADNVLSWLKNPTPTFDMSVASGNAERRTADAPILVNIMDLKGSSIVDTLGEQGHLKPKGPSVSPERPISHPAYFTLQEQPFPIEDNLVLCNYSSPTDFCVQNQSCLQVNCSTLEPSINASVVASKTFGETGGVPALGQLVLAQYEGAFYRAEVLDVDAGALLLRFVDYGNETRVPLTAAFPSTEEINRVPRLCFQCTYAEGSVPDLSKNDLSSLKMAHPENELIPLKFLKTLPNKKHLVSRLDMNVAHFLPLTSVVISPDVHLSSADKSPDVLLSSADKSPDVLLSSAYQSAQVSSSPATQLPAAETLVMQPTPQVEQPEVRPSPVSVPPEVKPCQLGLTPEIEPTSASTAPQISPPPAANPPRILATPSPAELPVSSRVPQGCLQLVEGPSMDCDINEFNNPSDFWLSIREEPFDLISLSHDLMTYGANSRPLLQEMPQVKGRLAKGALIAAHWMDGWYRAEVLEEIVNATSESLVRLRFIDYGNCDSIPLSETRLLLDRHLQLPRHSLPCRLSGLSLPDGQTEWSADSAQLVFSFMSETAKASVKIRKFKAEEGIFIAILFINGEPLQKSLVDAGLAVKLGSLGPGRTPSPREAAPVAVSETVPAVPAPLSASAAIPSQVCPLPPAAVDGNNNVSAPDEELNSALQEALKEVAALKENNENLKQKIKDMKEKNEKHKEKLEAIKTILEK